MLIYNKVKYLRVSCSKTYITTLYLTPNVCLLLPIAHHSPQWKACHPLRQFLLSILYWILLLPDKIYVDNFWILIMLYRDAYAFYLEGGGMGGSSESSVWGRLAQSPHRWQKEPISFLDLSQLFIASTTWLFILLGPDYSFGAWA